jgi:hypothetical protein
VRSYQERPAAHSVHDLAGSECRDAPESTPDTGEHETEDVAEANSSVDNDLVVLQRASDRQYGPVETRMILT